MATLNVPELIRRKREGGALGVEDLEQFISGYVAGTIPEYQVSAFLMAVFFRGMTPD
jgi:thymidine phosphorylase